MHYPLSEDYCLRSYVDDDAEALAHHASNPNIAKFLRDQFPQSYTRADAEAWIRHVRGRDPETIFAIATAEELIGNVGLYPQDDVYRLSAELGYWLAEEYWGRGIVSGAVKAICEIAFSRSDMVRIFSCVFEDNVGSCRVLEKCGFRLEGVHRKAVFKAGKITGEKMYSLLREEWQAAR